MAVLKGAVLFGMVMWISVVSDAYGSEGFTVEDDIRFSEFQEIGGREEFVAFSPNGKYFVVQTDKGRLDINRPESTLTIYQTADVKAWLVSGAAKPRRYMEIRESAHRNGPNISQLRWTPDSGALAYLAKTPLGRQRLHLANMKSRKTAPLSLEDQDVEQFAIVSDAHFAYTVLRDRPPAHQVARTEETVAYTGETSLREILFPESFYPDYAAEKTLCELWFAAGGGPSPVVDSDTGELITLAGLTPSRPSLSLSFDGTRVVTSLALASAPEAWETHYLPPDSSSAYRIVGGQQAESQLYLVRRYVQIDLGSGHISPLMDAPVADAAGWWHTEASAWSPDGRFVALSNVFLPIADALRSPNDLGPCLVVVDTHTRAYQCVENLRATLEAGLSGGFRSVSRLQFEDNRTLSVVYRHLLTGEVERSAYARFSRASWKAVDISKSKARVTLSIVESLSDRPLVAASLDGRKGYEVLYDPNEFMAEKKLGATRVFNWVDAAGRRWSGGLYLPPRYSSRNRYPLVIQDHGFMQNRFVPSGLYTSVHAARSLASAGIAVLQIQDCLQDGKQEIPCQLAGYVSAIEALSKEYGIDADRVGLVGFSRTCLYVMSALTDPGIKLAAAIAADGVNGGYFQALLSAAVARDAESYIGAAPYGSGLKQWFSHSPIFKLDQVSAPLRLEAAGGPSSLLFMWEPYALLTYMDKPVELVHFLASTTHPLTNPMQRLASQGGAVDWFRFWLQGYESDVASKAGQFARWREMRKQQCAALVGEETPWYCRSGKPAASAAWTAVH